MSKFAVGQKVVFRGYVNNLYYYGIIQKYYENTNRYSVLSKPSYASKNESSFKKESELFETIDECKQADVDEINKQIIRLKIRIDEINNAKNTINEVIIL